MSKNSSLVYSTEKGKHCPDCQQPKKQCVCKKSSHLLADKSGTIYISRESKGRKGAGVTLLEGIPLTTDELKQFAKKLKAQCGVGGSIKNNIIELQGDQREKAKKIIEKKFSNIVKFKGG